MWKRLRKFRTVAEQPFLKQGSWEPEMIKEFVRTKNLKRRVEQLTAPHYFYNVNDSVLLLASCFEASKQEMLEFSVKLWLESAHDVEKLWSQFEWRLLETFKWNSLLNNFSEDNESSLPKFFGEMLRMKPKSMWIKWPSEWSKMFPLCLRFSRIKTFLCNNFQINLPIFDLEQVRD